MPEVCHTQRHLVLRHVTHRKDTTRDTVTILRLLQMPPQTHSLPSYTHKHQPYALSPPFVDSSPVLRHPASPCSTRRTPVLLCSSSHWIPVCSTYWFPLCSSYWIPVCSTYCIPLCSSYCIPVCPDIAMRLHMKGRRESHRTSFILPSHTISTHHSFPPWLSGCPLSHLCNSSAQNVKRDLYT